MYALGVVGFIANTLTQFKMEFIPIEDDLLSLELDNVARDIFLVSSIRS